MQPAPGTFATKTEADRWLASAVTDQAQGRWVDAKAGKISLRPFSEEPAGLVAELEVHLSKFTRPDPSGLVFTSSGGGPIRQASFRNRHWYRAVRAAGVENIRFHDLRHVAGTLATISGATVREVQARLGHASPAAAYRYQHVLESRNAEIAERLNETLHGESRGCELIYGIDEPATNLPVLGGRTSTARARRRAG